MFTDLKRFKTVLYYFLSWTYCNSNSNKVIFVVSDKYIEWGDWGFFVECESFHEWSCGGLLVDVNEILADTHDISFSDFSLKKKDLRRTILNFMMQLKIWFLVSESCYNIVPWGFTKYIYKDHGIWVKIKKKLWY